MGSNTLTGGQPLAGLGRRTGAFVIDMLVFAVSIAVVFVVPMRLVSGSDSTGVAAAVAALFVVVVATGFFGYRIVLEALYGVTVGKKLLGIGVVTEGGGDVGWAAATLRNLALIADNFPAAYLLGAGLILYDDTDQRLGDMAANTYVVRV